MYNSVLVRSRLVYIFLNPQLPVSLITNHHVAIMHGYFHQCNYTKYSVGRFQKTPWFLLLDKGHGEYLHTLVVE